MPFSPPAQAAVPSPPGLTAPSPHRPIPLVVMGFALLSLAILGLLPFLQLGDGSNIPRLALFMGRFHPVVLHVPIGMILLAILLEHAHIRGLRRWIPKVPPGTSTFLMSFAAISATVSTVLGWMLSFSGGYDPVLLQRHFIAGVSTGIGANLAIPAPRIRWRDMPIKSSSSPPAHASASRDTGVPRSPMERIISRNTPPIPSAICSASPFGSTPRISPGSRSRTASRSPTWSAPSSMTAA